MKTKKIEYLFHINNDYMAQFWAKGTTQKYLSKPSKYMPAKLVNSSAEISAPAPLPIDILGRCGIRNAGLTTHLSGYYFCRQKNAYNDIIFVMNGKFSADFDGKKNELRSGEILCVPAGCLCDDKVKSGKTTVFWLHLDNSPHWNFGAETKILRPENFFEITAVMKLYLDEVYRENRSVCYLEKIADVLEELLHRLFGGSKISRSGAVSAYAEAIAKAPSKNWNRTAAAKHLKVSPAVADKMFLEATGKTVSKTVAAARMKAAAKFLENGGRDFEKLAAKTGYSSVSALSKAFKRFYGKSLKNFAETDIGRFSC